MEQNATITSTRCVWMDAGVLTYKLCDRAFACEECPLDLVLRHSDDTPMRSGKVPCIHVQCTLPDGADPEVARLMDPALHVDLPEDLLYSEHHVWVKTLASRAVLFGLDPALMALLPSSSRLVMSSGRAALERGKPFAWLYSGQRVFPLRSPLTGTVLKQNPNAESDARRRPDTWMLAMMPTHFSDEACTLVPATDSAAQHEALLSKFSSRALRALAPETGGVFLNDGGTAVLSLEQALGEERYFELMRAVFFPR